ncbi:hypothetical protein [Flavobacterium beibuense]|uniref:hypothetical protein n=1 Tax=Flavobacterium beibuense TaxID=657326 RepID=UPI003A94D595
MIARTLAVSILSFACLTLSLSAQSLSDSAAIKQIHLVTYEQIFSKNCNSWSVQYREFEKESQEFVIPITLSFGNTKVRGNLLEDKNIKNVDTYALGFGFDGYEYMGDGLYFNLGVGVSPGIESIEKQNNDKNTKFLIGGIINTGLLYVPFSDFGLVIGLKITGRLSNSDVLARSLGFGIEAGFNF